MLTFRDISQRVLLEYHAFHDSLTGLPNRRIFLDRLQHALKRVDRTGEIHAVLFADIDRFKMTNDSLGHQAGDELLVCIGDRLRRLTREGDTLARFGGDEFTLLLENIDSPEAAEAMALRIIEAVRSPMTLAGGRTITASVSIGISIATAGSTPDDVLHDADVAMYQAKRLGADRFARFDAAAMITRSVERLDLEFGLRRAVEQQELTVHYQPLVATGNGQIVGVEALVRWEHPALGILSPASFIGLAEETGLIFAIGRQVLEEACHQAKRWVDDHGLPFSVAVNLSARQFQQPGLVEEVSTVLALSGLHPSHLCLEITEGMAMSDIDHTIRTLTDSEVAWCPPCHRRLRHGLLLAELPEAPAGRLRQTRQGLRAGPRERPGRRCHRGRRHGARPCRRHDGRGRRSRNGRPARPPLGHGLPARSGLLPVAPHVDG